MASKNSPPKSTGGGGFVFETDVGAWLLAYMLSGESPFEPELGRIIKIAFQTHVDGWLLDDVLVTNKNGEIEHRHAFSIKSNAQFTSTVAPKDFVACAWKQWLHVESKVFDRDRDFMGLITKPISEAAKTSLSNLTEKIRNTTDPSTFSDRIKQPRWASTSERKLFASFSCPSDIPPKSRPNDIDKTKLLQRLRFLHCDFGMRNASSRKQAISICKKCITDKFDTSADMLWNTLCAITDELRPVAGDITLQKLVDRLRTQFRLEEYPDYSADWNKLDIRSSREANLVIDTIANHVHLPRTQSVDALAHANEENDLVAFLGASGVGKSAVAKALLAKRIQNHERSLWIDAQSLSLPDFGTFETTLGLQYPLEVLLAHSTASQPVLILDGLDRHYAENTFRNAAMLLRMVRKDKPATQWKVILPCQQQEWSRVSENLQRAGLVGYVWKQQQLDSLTTTDLKPVIKEIPQISRLTLQNEFSSLLTNLKMLDMIARHAGTDPDINPDDLVGESSVANWFWTTEVDRGGANDMARSECVQKLAQRQADQLVASVKTEKFDASELTLLSSLVTDQICVRVSGGRIAFSHDLYGDWVRLQILINHSDDLPSFFKDRQGSPLWHRALRLFGVYLLEHSNGVSEWRTIFTKIQDNVLRDVLLEASVYSVNARQLLDALLDDLMEKDGQLLKRLLARFLAFATVPDEQKVGVALLAKMEVSKARADYRRPYWPLWLGMLAFLYKHRNRVVPTAPDEVARVVEMWLEFAPKGSVYKSEMAELAILLGDYALSAYEVDRYSLSLKNRRRFFKCVLLATEERTNEVIRIALSASRRPLGNIKENDKAMKNLVPGNQPFVVETSNLNKPWADGPNTKIDEEFRKVVLDEGPIIRLFQERPEVAREIILANLIREPVKGKWDVNRFRQEELAVVNKYDWTPALYTHGPFLLCLMKNFIEGLEIIARLVEFAASRAKDVKDRQLQERRTHVFAEGQHESSASHRTENQRSNNLILIGTDGISKKFQGDEWIYGWSTGQGNPPQVVRAALMALEQYFYMRIHENKNVNKEVSIVLERTQSVAFLGVLADVGKKQISLFEGPLLPLFSAPEIYLWEINKIIKIDISFVAEYFFHSQLLVNMAKSFRNLDHRKYDLRDIAIKLMLHKPDVCVYLQNTLKTWSENSLPDDQVGDMQKRLAIAFNIDNYEVQKDPELGIVFVNTEGLRIEKENVDERQATEDRQEVMSFLVNCQTILDERKILKNAELESLWKRWEQICKISEKPDELSNILKLPNYAYPSAIAGGIAVFVRHFDWCNKNIKRTATVKQIFQSFLDNPPEWHGFDKDQTPATSRYDCFTAETIAMFWVRDRENKCLRRMVGEKAMSSIYEVVRLLFNSCANHRTTLGNDFERLRRVALERAYIQSRLDFLRHASVKQLAISTKKHKQMRKALHGWANECLNAFIAKKMHGMPADWGECDNPTKFTELDAIRKKRSMFPNMDFRVVRSAHEWLPLPDQALDEKERANIICFLRSSLQIIIPPPASDPAGQDYKYPQEDERWVLENVGAAILQLRENENADLLWEPVLDIRGERCEWLGMLAYAIHKHALTTDPTPKTYPGLVSAILERSLKDVNGEPRWYWGGGVWDALIGVDQYSQDFWGEQHVDIVASMEDVFFKWMKSVTMRGARVNRVVSWLSKPAAVQIRIAALGWLLEIVQMDNDAQIRDISEAEDSIAILLDVIWRNQEQELRANPTSLSTFQKLLLWLADRQNPTGLELLGRLGRLA